MRHRTMAGFVAAFDPVARLAERPASCGTTKSDTGHTVLDEEGGRKVINLPWRDYRSLHDFVYRSDHGRLLLGAQRVVPADPAALDRAVVGAGRRAPDGRGEGRCAGTCVTT